MERCLAGEAVVTMARGRRQLAGLLRSFVKYLGDNSRAQTETGMRRVFSLFATASQARQRSTGVASLFPLKFDL